MPIIDDIYHIAVCRSWRTHPLVASPLQVMFDVAKQFLNIGGDLCAENHELSGLNVQEDESAMTVEQRKNKTR